MMLDALQFVAATTGDKSNHLTIRNGRITAFNGTMALSSDIDVDLDICPNAAELMAALKACSDGVMSLNVTPTGRLAVKSERFRAYVNCLPPGTMFHVESQGETIELGELFLPGLKAIAPIMGTDQARPWAMGVKLQNQSMYATNNAMLVEYWHGAKIPIDVVIPSVAVNELIRINQPPDRVQVCDNSMTFWFGPTRWLRTQLIIDSPWPMNRVSDVLDKPKQAVRSFPEGFFESVKSLKPFLSERSTVILNPNYIATHLESESVGAIVEIRIPGLICPQAYHYKHLLLLENIAETIDWNCYPQPAMFYSFWLRGAMSAQVINAA